MPVRLQLFGSPTAEVGEGAVALPFERRNQLLAFLALRRSWVGRGEVATLLWPEHDTKLAHSNLRKTLFRLQGIAWAEGLEVQGGALRFMPATDVASFEEALREGRVTEALALVRGELLKGFESGASEGWSAWLAFERERLATAWRAAALGHLGADIEAAEAVALAARLLEADPLDEAALRAYMAGLARTGQAAQARQAYRNFVQRLEEELGLAPPAELKVLHDALGGEAAPAVKAPSLPQPAADPGFVGRGLELKRIAEQLGSGDCRLLSLVGPGGVGKTRLARRALAELGSSYPDGTAFVALEDAAGAHEIAPRVARALGIGITGRGDPMEQVILALLAKRVLLVLDNFEHLVAGAPVLERLLAGCPEVRIVATSRVRLALSMERLLPLDGLPCPEPEDHDRLGAFDAVRLFVAAARRVQPALAAESEAEAIADICRQVDGLPLALELAAAWTRVLSCAAIAAELRHGTELLRAVDAAHPPRHASIELVFEHSWRLLGTAEREALARLAVFRGGFTVDAARAVAGASLPVLGALADKSLLRKEGERLFLHPLVLQLAGSRLEGEARAATERSHALHFHRLLAQLRRAAEDGDREALRRIDAEFDNCGLAWRWAVAHAQGEALARSVPALLHYCDHRGRLEEGLAMLGEALDSDLSATPGLPARLRGAAAHLEYRLDRYAQAEASATHALGQATRGAADHETRLQCFKVLGGCCLRTGRLEEARGHFQRALAQAPAEVDPHNAAAMLDNLALIEKWSGRYDEALRLSMESLTQHRRLDDVAGVSLCLNNLGSLYLERGDFAAAVPYLREALAICERHGHVSTRTLVLANLAEIAMRTGDLGEAETRGESALEAARAAGNRALASYIQVQMALVALRRANLARARAGLAAAMETATALGRPSLLLAGACAFAELLAAQGETESARQVLAFAAEHPSMGASERDQARRQLAAFAGGPLPAWPGIELAELAQRIVAESGAAHAPLISTLAAAR